MNFSSVLVLFAFLKCMLIHAHVYTQDAVDCSKRPNGVYPNINSCLSFHECSNGHHFLQNCPLGLHFNPNLLYCDWPDSSGCTKSTSSRTTELTQNTITTIVDDATYRDTDAEYISKSSLTPSPVETTHSPLSTSQPRTVLYCVGRVGRPCGYFPDPENCQNFYQCVEGDVAILRQCPDSLHFNIALQLCDLPGRVNCGAINCQTSENGNYQNFQNCHTFITCSNGYTHLMDCPSNLVYHPDDKNVGWCDYKEKASQFCLNGELD